MDEQLTTPDGIALHLRAWPIATPGRGTVLIVHGLGEHIGRYEHVAAHLNAGGWNVVGYDQRGHGRSGGARGRLSDAADFLRDLGQVIDAIRETRSETLVLLGHSLGGLVAARFVAEGVVENRASWWRPVDALALSSPALDPGMSVGQKLLLAILGRLAPNLAVSNGVNPQWVSRDPKVVQQYMSDPLVHDRIAARLARFVVDASALVLQRAARWNVRTLLMYAGSDRLVRPARSRAFSAAAPSALVQVRAFPSLYHEILNEPEQDEVLAVLVDWL